MNHPNVDMFLVHGWHSLAAILTQSQSFASVTLLQVCMMSKKRTHDEKKHNYYNYTISLLAAHTSVVAVEMQAFPVLEPEF